MLLKGSNMAFKSSRAESTHVSVPESAVLLSSSVLSRSAYLCEVVGDEGRCKCALLKSPAVWQDLILTANIHHACTTTVLPPGATVQKLLLDTAVRRASHAVLTENMEQVSADTYCRSQVACSVPALKSKLYYDRRSVGQSVLVSGTHLGPSTNLPPKLTPWL
jgi:hypothetical protein